MKNLCCSTQPLRGHRPLSCCSLGSPLHPVRRWEKSQWRACRFHLHAISKNPLIRPYLMATRPGKGCLALCPGRRGGRGSCRAPADCHGGRLFMSFPSLLFSLPRPMPIMGLHVFAPVDYPTHHAGYTPPKYFLWNFPRTPRWRNTFSMFPWWFLKSIFDL